MLLFGLNNSCHYVVFRKSWDDDIFTVVYR